MLPKAKKDEKDTAANSSLKLVTFYQTHKPEAKGTMKEYFLRVMDQVKDESHPHSGQSIERLLSLNREMTAFIYDLNRLMKAARYKQTDKLIEFYKSEIPSSWSQKPVTFNVIKGTSISEKDIKNIISNQENVMINNCVSAVMSNMAGNKFYLADMLLDMYEDFGLEFFINFALQDKSETPLTGEKLLLFKMLAMEIVGRKLISTGQAQKMGIFAQPESSSNNSSIPPTTQSDKAQTTSATTAAATTALKPPSAGGQ